MLRGSLVLFAAAFFWQVCGTLSWAESYVGIRPSVIYSDCLLRDPSVWFEITVTESAIDRAPKWKEKDENPPLSARRAIELADMLRAKLVNETEEWKWHLECVSLTPFDPESPRGRWFWQISYYAVQDGTYARPLNHLHLAVLMDGTVVEPKIQKREPRSKQR